MFSSGSHHVAGTVSWLTFGEAVNDPEVIGQVNAEYGAIVAAHGEPGVGAVRVRANRPFSTVNTCLLMRVSSAGGDGRLDGQLVGGDVLVAGQGDDRGDDLGDRQDEFTRAPGAGPTEGLPDGVGGLVELLLGVVGLRATAHVDVEEDVEHHRRLVRGARPGPADDDARVGGDVGGDVLVDLTELLAAQQLGDSATHVGQHQATPALDRSSDGRISVSTSGSLAMTRTENPSGPNPSTPVAEVRRL